MSQIPDDYNPYPGVKIFDHSGDGIEEYDNGMPTWWLMLFYGSIIFSVVYCFQYPSFWFWEGSEKWSTESYYQAQMAAAPAKKNDPSNVVLADEMKKPEVMELGKKTFVNTCSPCHGMNAEGKIGPCLTDKVWKYGDSDKELLISIRKGRPLGMPPWEKALKQDQVVAVAAYVHSIGNTTETPANTTTPGGATSPTPSTSSTPGTAGSATPSASPTPNQSATPTAVATP